MRIALVLSGLGAGGAERVAAILAEAWIARGWDVAVICFERNEVASYHVLPAEVRILRRAPPKIWSALNAPFELAARLLFLRRSLRRHDPDIVVSFLTKNNVLSLLAGFGVARPLLVCERNNPLRQEVRPIWHRLQDRLAGRAILVLQTESSRRAFGAKALARSRVIPNPVEPSAFEADTTLQTIVAVGRLSRQKGFDLLLEAFAKVASSRPDWTLVIWGEGPMRESLQRQVESLGLKSRVRMPGITPRQGEWVRSGSIFVLSSRYEGFPNVLVEAMSAGMAVASFDCPFGPADILRHAEDGLLVAEGDVSELADRLDDLMSDGGLRTRLGQNARRNVRRFATDAIVARWDDVLTSALTDRSPERIGRSGLPSRP